MARPNVILCLLHLSVVHSQTGTPQVQAITQQHHILNVTNKAIKEGLNNNNILYCPEGYVPINCHITGFGIDIRGVKTQHFSPNALVGCSIRNMNASSPAATNMTVQCVPRILTDPCSGQTYKELIPSTYVKFARGKSVKVHCNREYKMESCALSLVTNDMRSLKIQLDNYRTGQVPILHNTCEVNDCVGPGQYPSGVQYACSIQAVCLLDLPNIRHVCAGCTSAHCYGSDTCRFNRKHQKEISYGCSNSGICRIPSGYRCQECVLTPVNCIDIDECVEQKGVCGEMGVCHNTQGGYECKCPATPCTDEHCTNLACGTGTCYRESITGQVECMYNTTETTVTMEINGNVATVMCASTYRLNDHIWYVGEVAMGQHVQSTGLIRDMHMSYLRLDTNLLSDPVVVTCVKQSLWINRVSRAAILILPTKPKSPYKGKKKKKTKTTKNKRKKVAKKKKKKGKHKKKSKGKVKVFGKKSNVTNHYVIQA